MTSHDITTSCVLHKTFCTIQVCYEPLPFNIVCKWIPWQTFCDDDFSEQDGSRSKHLVDSFTCEGASFGVHQRRHRDVCSSLLSRKACRMLTLSLHVCCAKSSKREERIPLILMAQVFSQISGFASNCLCKAPRSISISGTACVRCRRTPLLRLKFLFTYVKETLSSCLINISLLWFLSGLWPYYVANACWCLLKWGRYFQVFTLEAFKWAFGILFSRLVSSSVSRI